MNINEIFGGNHVKTADLKGREHTVTIESICFKEFPGQNGQPPRTKPVISFVGKPKTFVCNPTCGAAIAFLYGPETDNWIGKKITLFPTQTQFGSGMVDCIRVKPPATHGAIGNGQPPRPQHQQIIEQRSNYALSSMKPVPARDGLEEVLGEDSPDIGSTF
jgi:hypothetical protein